MGGRRLRSNVGCMHVCACAGSCTILALKTCCKPHETRNGFCVFIFAKIA